MGPCTAACCAQPHVLPPSQHAQCAPSPYTRQGYIYGCVSALLSAVAAVYTEWVLKKNNDTLYWQNMLLYGFGAFFNFLTLAHRCGGKWGWVVRVAGWRAVRQLLLGLGAAAGSLER